MMSELMKTFGECMNAVADRNYCTKLVGLSISLANTDEIRYAGRVKHVIRLPEDAEHSALVGISRSLHLLVSLLGNNYTVHLKYRWDGGKFELESAEVVTTEVALMLNPPPPPD
jgi:hypothetical protein